MKEHSSTGPHTSSD